MPSSGTTGWLRADTLPAFGKLPTDEDYEGAHGDMKVEILGCVRDAPEGIPDVVNVLHISPDMGLVDTKIVRVIDFMEKLGFTVERDGGQDRWPATDILILGTDKSHMPNVDRILSLARNAGLVMGWNVLLYGTDGMPELKPGLHGNPLRTDRNFEFDTICMLHAHMRLRNDLQFWIGYIAYMVDLIEYNITRLIKASPRIKPLNGRDKLSCKIDILASVLRDASVRDQDVELFSRTAHLLRRVRNAHVHLMGRDAETQLDTDEPMRCMSEFSVAARQYGRGDLLLVNSFYFPAINTGVMSSFTPQFVRLALLTDSWMHDCLRHCTSLPAELHDD